MRFILEAGESRYEAIRFILLAEEPGDHAVRSVLEAGESRHEAVRSFSSWKSQETMWCDPFSRRESQDTGRYASLSSRKSQETMRCDPLSRLQQGQFVRYVTELMRVVRYTCVGRRTRDRSDCAR